MKHKGLYNASLILSGICALVAVTAIGIFIYNFSSSDISNKPENWGQFGDFFGGILNPILALVNICVFVILTLEIQKLTDKSNSASLETSRKIALMSLKHEELKHFKEVMDRSLGEWDIETNIRDLMDLEGIYINLTRRMNFLFPQLNQSENHFKMRQFLNKLISAYNDDMSKDKINVATYSLISQYYAGLVSDLSEWTVS